MYSDFDKFQTLHWWKKNFSVKEKQNRVLHKNDSIAEQKRVSARFPINNLLFLQDYFIIHKWNGKRLKNYCHLTRPGKKYLLKDG